MKNKQIFLFISVFFLISVLIKLYLLFGSEYIVEGDEALVGIQAIHFLKGITKHPFVYGQDYMGSLESLTISIFFLLFGVSYISLKLVPLFYYILFILVFCLFTKKYFEINTAILVFLFLAFPSLTLSRWLFSPTGGHIENLFLSALLLFFAYKIIYLNSISNFDFINFGFLAGFAFWTNPFSIFLLLILLFFILYKYKNFFIKKFFIWLIFFIFGSLPLWLYNIQNNFITIKKLGAFFLGIRKSEAHYLNLFIIIKNLLFKIFYILNNFPDTIKLVFHTLGFSFNFLSIILFSIILLSAFIFFIVEIIKTKSDNYRVLPLILFTIFYLLIISASSRNIRDRYLLPLFLSIPIILSHFLYIIYFRYFRKKFFILAVFLFYIFINTHSIFNYVNNNFVNSKEIFEAQKKLINFLISKNIEFAYADNYTGYPISFLSKEKIIISPKAGFYNEDRITYYSNLVDNAEKKAIIFNTAILHNINSKNIFENKLIQKQIICSTKKINTYYIYYDFSQSININEFDLPLRFRKK